MSNYKYTSAYFDETGQYRYLLERMWDADLPCVAFVGLNPSTADGTKDDATIRKCVTFAKSLGFGRLWMVNLFAFRATQPAAMMRLVGDPIGKDNDSWLLNVASKANKVVMAYGKDGIYLGRDYAVIKLLKNSSITLYCLGTNKNKTPKHPLYLKGDTALQKYEMAVAQ